MSDPSLDDREWLGDDAVATDAAFDRALDLEDAELERFLDSLPEARRRRVAGLLRAAEAGGPLDDQLGSVAGHLLETAGEHLEADAAGRRLGSWRLLERLGSGGMGVVYLAERAGEGFEQRAALKVIRWELADSVLVQRFLAERQILAQLSHPHIASLLDGGMTAEGLPYLVLEFVDGEPVDVYCKNAALDLEARIRLVVKICRAVDFAHRQLVVHRDLKPSNILVRGDGVPKLVDFGVAKLLDDASGDPTILAPMTPRYAAPEQRRGEAVSIATDVWSLGVVLREIVTGDVGAGAEARPDASEGPLRGDLANILGLALREEPEARYRSAAALADDLERYLEGRPVNATPPTLGYRLAKLAKRQRAAVVAGLAALVLAVLGVAGIVWQAREARAERDAARLEAVRAEEVTSFLRGLFESSTPRLGEQPKVRDLLDEGAERIRHDLEDAPEARARLLVTLGNAYKWLLEFDRAEELLREAIRLEERLEPGSEQHALAVASLGGVFLHGEEAARAEKYLLEALAMFDAAGVGRTTHRGDLLNSLGMARLDLDDPEAAVDYLRRSAEIFRQLESPSLGAALGNLALGLDHLGEHRRAEERHREALEIYRRTSPTSTTITTLLNNLTKCLASQGRLDEALETIREAARLGRRAGEAAGDSLATTEGNLAYMLLLHGRSAEAVELARGAATTFEAHFDDSTSLLASRANLGWALTLEQRYDEALPILEDVASRFEAKLGSEHRLAARSRLLQGAAHARAGHGAVAARLVDDAIEILERDEVDALPSSVGDAHLARGALRCDRGELEPGLADLEKALEAYAEVREEDHWHLALARVEKARCLDALGRPWDSAQLTADRARLVAARGEDAWSTLRSRELQ